MTRMPLFVAIFGLMLHGQADICLLKEASKRDQHFKIKLTLIHLISQHVSTPVFSVSFLYIL